VLLQDGATVASTLNSMSTSLSDVAASTTQSLGNDVDAANTAATQLNSVNSQIAIGTATGANVNSLLDQRDQLLDQLSSLVGGVATINPNGTASVQVGGQDLVIGAYNGTPASVNSITVDSTPTVSVGGTGVTLTGGSAAASVTTLTTTLPQMQSQLDAVASALASAVNGAQANGYDLSGNAGTAIFGTSDGSGTVTAANIAVTMTDPSLVAAAATSSSGGNLDGGNALVASNLGSAAGSADKLYGGLVGQIGSASKLAQQQQSTQDAVTASVDTLRQSASGVNLDEELTNMLTLQRAYQASSRVLTTMDSLLDTLINHTGA
jgi:flagellar hook-associated protein 1 FlgK